EELRVVETGAQHSFVAVANHSITIPIGVEHGKEVRGQLSARVFHSEVLLMIAHYGDQHFLRQREEIAIEAAENHSRKLRKVHDSLQQLRVFAPSRSRPPPRLRIKSFPDLGQPLDGVGYYLARLKLFYVFIGAGNRHRSRRKDAMPARAIPCSNPCIFQRKR